jgi:uncharacterized protein YeaO (DUF488 family)
MYMRWSMPFSFGIPMHPILCLRCFMEVISYDQDQKGLRSSLPRGWQKNTGRSIMAEGIQKKEAKVDEWLKESAPSVELRKWFSHDPSKYQEFKKRYLKELQKKSELLQEIKNETKKETVTLLFSAKDTEHNNAIVLKEILTP